MLRILTAWLLAIAILGAGAPGNCQTPDELDADEAQEKLQAELDLIEFFKTGDRSALWRVDLPRVSIAIPSLTSALDDESVTVRMNAAEALGWYGPAAGSAAPKLIELLDDPDPFVRQAAEGSLGRIGPRAGAAVPWLIRGLHFSQDGEEDVVSQTAVDALGCMGPEAVPALLRAVQDRYPYVRAGSINALGRIVGAGPDVVAAVLSATHDPEATVRAAAIEVLGEPDLLADDVMVALVGALADPDENVRELAATAHGKHGIASKSAVPALIKIVQDRPQSRKTNDRNALRGLSILALGMIGAEAATAVPTLVQVLANPDDPRQEAAAEALARIGTPAKEVVAALTGALEAQDLRTRVQALKGLARMGPAAERAALPLQKVLAAEHTRDYLFWDSGDPREFALKALARIGPAGIPGLIEGLRHNEPRIREKAAQSLVDVGPPARPAVDHLIDALCDDEESVRARSADALGRIGAEVDKCVPALIRALDDEVTVRQAAIVALGHFGSGAKVAVGPLMVAVKRDANDGGWGLEKTLVAIGPSAAGPLAELLSDPNSAVRVKAARPLWRIEQRAEVIDVLIAVLKDENDRVRRQAIWAIQAIGPAAKAAVPLLTDALHDPELEDEAADALIQIGAADVAAPFLIAALTDEINEDRRYAAAETLTGIGAAGGVAVPALIAACNDPHPFVRAQAVEALGHINAPGRASATTAADLLYDPELEVQRDAALAVWRIDRNPRAVPFLIRRLGGNGRSYSAIALGEIGPPASAAVPALIRELSTHLDLESSETCADLVNALGAIGPAAIAAEPILTQALSHLNATVRQNARDALRKIHPQ